MSIKMSGSKNYIRFLIRYLFKANKKKEEEIEIPQEENKEVFEERIKNSLEENGKKKYEDRRGVKSQSFIAIDGDLPPKVESGKNTPATNELDPLNPALNSFLELLLPNQLNQTLRQNRFSLCIHHISKWQLQRKIFSHGKFNRVLKGNLIKTDSLCD